MTKTKISTSLKVEHIWKYMSKKVHWAKLLVASLVTFSNGDDANAIVMLRKKDYVSWANNGVGYLYKCMLC
jgi:hypothetical protein